MSFVEGLRCRECGRAFPAEALHVCDWCFGPLEVIYDYEAIAANTTRASIAAGPTSIWRYANLLPAVNDGAVDLGAGFTPLVRADRLAAQLGLGELWLKNDTLNPTGSFKDRVVAVALARARAMGFKVAACASTGNLANSVAAHAARAGMRHVVFIPADLEQGKVITTAVYGPQPGRGRRQLRRRQPAVRRARLRAPDVGVRQRQPAHLLRRGVQDPGLRDGRAARVDRSPDHVVVPVASGSQLTKIAKGFEELWKVGLLDEEPHVRISGAQAEGCSPVATAFEGGHDFIRPVRPKTIAKSLAIGNPADGFYALETVRASGGALTSVTDDEIRDAMLLLARTEGIFAETAGGVTIATLAKLAASGVVRRDERVVAYITGHGLKTLEAIAPLVGPTVTIAPTMAAFEAAMGAHEEI